MMKFIKNCAFLTACFLSFNTFAEVKERIVSIGGDCNGLKNCNNSKTIFDKLSQHGELQNG